MIVDNNRIRFDRVRIDREAIIRQVSLWEAGDLGCGVICEMRSGLAQPFAPPRGMMPTRVRQEGDWVAGGVELGCRLNLSSRDFGNNKAFQEDGGAEGRFWRPASRRDGYIRF